MKESREGSLVGVRIRVRVGGFVGRWAFVAWHVGL